MIKTGSLIITEVNAIPRTKPWVQECSHRVLGKALRLELEAVGLRDCHHGNRLHAADLVGCIS